MNIKREKGPASAFLEHAASWLDPGMNSGLELKPNHRRGVVLAAIRRDITVSTCERNTNLNRSAVVFGSSVLSFSRSTTPSRILPLPARCDQHDRPQDADIFEAT